MFVHPFTVQTPDSQVTRREVTLATPPEQWSVDDTVQALWAIQRALAAACC